jgi:hypothetical protein
MLHRARERDREDVDLDRLRDEVVRAGANRADRGLERAECRHDDDRHVRMLGHDVRAEVEPARLTHAQVRHDDVEVARLEGLARSGRAGAPRGFVAALRERAGERLAEAPIVVDDEHAAAHDASRSAASGAGGR